MGENTNRTYDEIRNEIEDQCRKQLEAEVEKRKEIEEKYYEIYEQLQETTKSYEKLYQSQMEIVQINRDFLECKLSFLQYMKQRNVYRKREQDLLNKNPEFWAPVFDAAYYAEHHKDVVEEVGTDASALLKHFISIGTYQARQGCKDFDVERYLEYNDDVAQMCRADKRSAYLHYIDYGMNEKRKK